MRARGARVTDIAVIVVAADDGVMPQTLEAISHARAAKVPIVIALNKIDKPDANPDRVKTELAEANVVVEEYGGDVPLVPVSAKARVGLEELLEMILLVADLQELKANPKRPAVGTIIEAELDKGRGPVATVVVQTGTLRDRRRRRRRQDLRQGARPRERGGQADPRRSAPRPPRWCSAWATCRRPATSCASWRTRRPRGAGRGAPRGGRRAGSGTSQRRPSRTSSSQFKDGQAKELRIILKADVSGSLGAITHALEQIQSDEVRISILHEGTGDITDTDILLASASNAIVVGFNTKLDRRRAGRRRPSGSTSASTTSSTS